MTQSWCALSCFPNYDLGSILSTSSNVMMWTSTSTTNSSVYKSLAMIISLPATTVDKCVLMCLSGWTSETSTQYKTLVLLVRRPCSVNEAIDLHSSICQWSNWLRLVRLCNCNNHGHHHKEPNLHQMNHWNCHEHDLLGLKVEMKAVWMKFLQT